MTVQDILDQIDIQCQCHVVYYDEEKNERVEILDEEKMLNSRIQYMYSEDDEIYFEVEV